MLISVFKAREEIANAREQHHEILSSRIHILLEELFEEDLKGRGEASLFEILVRLILLADQVPARTLADLLVPYDAASLEQLEPSTVSEAALFLRDYLKKDTILTHIA